MPGKLINAKDLVSAASMEIGLIQKPITTIVSTLDQDIAQMVALMSAVADEVLLEEPYQTSLGDGIWCISSPGSAPRWAGPTQDTDLILFDARLAIDGLKYRFLKAKGLEYGEEMRDFSTRLSRLASRAVGRVLDLDAEQGRVA